jgi:tetratricopeptide (TPR) repeat protein
MGRYEEGSEQIEQVLALQPDFPEAMYNKACVYCLRKDAQAAFEWLQKAIGADPRYMEVALKEPNFDFLRKHSEMGPRFRDLVGK